MSNFLVLFEEETAAQGHEGLSPCPGVRGCSDTGLQT